MKRRKALGKSFMRQIPPHKTGFFSSNPRYREQENENDTQKELDKSKNPSIHCVQKGIALL